jgi:endoglucanase
VILDRLCDTRGVSGDEGEIREVIREAVAPLVDDWRVDALGNLICHKCASAQGSKQKVMLAAHMDEVGLMITGINADGTLRFGQVGGIDDRVLLAKALLIGSGRVPGVIGYRPIHLLAPGDTANAPDIKRAAIDIGATSKEGAEKLVNVGDYVSFDTSFETLDDDPAGLRMVKGKALDDRAGCAALIELLADRYPFELYAVFTTQEEVGLRGARVAAYAIAPDLALVLEGTICDDLPKKRDESPVTRVGDGPAITFMDRSFVADRRLFGLLVETAKEMGIPHQLKQAIAGGTDSGAIHLAREGIPSATVAVPARSIHAPVSMMSMRDYDHTVQLVRAALHKLGGGLPA